MRRIKLAVFMLAVAFVYVGTASAESVGDVADIEMTPEAAREALDQGSEALSSLTDPEAAETLPRHDLDRAQALALFSAVFGTHLEGAAGVFGDLDVQRFLSDNAAVIASGDRPEGSGVMIGGDPYTGPALLESTVPLRTEESGDEETVDLGLEQAEGEIQPAVPLFEVGIPSDLGEGIELADSGVRIALAGAPGDRSPSIVDETVAVYPEVAEDTSFAVAPTPTGLETFTLLQSPSAPLSTTYQLTLPEGFSLSPTEDGGANVMDGDQPVLRIFPPAALDAEAAEVPVALEVSGSSFAVRAEPQEDAAYPILVDPVIESYNWYGTNTSTNLGHWTGTSNDQGLLYNTKSALGLPGTDLRAVKGFKLPYNAKAKWTYSVPRYAADLATFGVAPTSYISSMVLTNLFFVTGSDKSLHPMMAAGIWNQTTNNWMSAWAHGGNTGNIENMATTYTFTNTNQDAKQAVSNELWAGEAHTMTSDRETYVGSATIELADKVAPGIGSFSPPTKWVDSNAPAIPFTASDSGLGVSNIRISEVGGSPLKNWTTWDGCTGTVANACPRTWKDTDAGSPALKYEPSALTQGIRKMSAVARDALNNSSNPYEFNLKVDHTAPGVALAGTLTQQATLGSSRPSYVLTTTSTDGTTAEPQAGIVSTEIKIDGKVVDSTNAGCATQNCSVSRNWTLDASAYSPGKHTVVVKATDGVGRSTEKTLSIELQPDTTKPTIENFGTLYDAPSGWVEQKPYELLVTSGDYDYGVESLEFKMDGKVVESTEEACPNGGCGAWMEVEVDMSSYKGGAHTASIVAVDGAGNVSTESWTVNVNPEGEVSAAEAIDTLEAVEETSDVFPVAPTAALVDPAELEAGINPALKQVGTALESTGTGATTIMTTFPADGITIESADGDIEIDPMAGSSSTPNEVTVDAVAVSGGSDVDTVIRPIYDGSMTYKSIRDWGAPEIYSWKVSLNEGQKLENVDSQHVAIVYEDGTRALLITAEPSRDATGKEVPTGIAASEGNVLTLTVKHRNGGFVYPVVGGPSFQSSYTAPVIWEPPTEEEEYSESAELIVSAPEPLASEEASASAWGAQRRKFMRPICGLTSFYSGGYRQRCGNPFTGQHESRVIWHAGIRGAFLYKAGYRAEHRNAIACAQNAYQASILSLYYLEEPYECHYGHKTNDGNGGAIVSAGHYLRAQAHWKVGHRGHCGNECNGTPNPILWEDKAVELHLWPSGAVDLTVP